MRNATIDLHGELMYLFFYQDFLLIMKEKVREVDIEIHFKDTFKVFSKDKEGKIVMLTIKIYKSFFALYILKGRDG